MALKQSALWTPFVFVFFMVAGASSDYQWQQFNAAPQVSSFTFKNDTAWICSDVGLGRMSTSGGPAYFYNNANSGCVFSPVYGVAIDRNGIKWIAANGGIMRFDGAQWNHFDTTNSPLNSVRISQVVVDSNNIKWFSCAQNYGYIDGSIRYWGGGLVRYDDKDWTLFDSTDPGLRTSRINKMAAGPRALWLLTSKGLCRRSADGSWKYFDSSNSPLPPSRYYNTMAVDPQGTAWVLWTKSSSFSDTNYLGGIDTAEQWRIIRLNDSIPKGFTRDIQFSIDASGWFWFWQTSVGIVVYDKKTWQPYYYKNSQLPQVFYPTITGIDENHRMWFTMFRDTLWVFDVPSVRTFKLQDSKLPFRGFCSMTQDKNGVYWIGSYKGVLTLAGDSFTVYDTSNSGLVYNYRSKIAIDSMNRKWFGTNCGGMSMYDDVKWTSYTKNDSSIPDNCINDLMFDPSGNLWMTLYSGVCIFKGTSYRQYTLGNVSNIGIDKFGTLWAGSPGGPHVFTDTGWTFKGPQPGLSISALRVAPDGAIWCTASSGVYCYNGAAWKVFDTAAIGAPLSSDLILADSKGTVWVPTSRGMATYDGATWSILTQYNSGLPQKSSQPLFEDKLGNIWFTTPNGLAVRRNISTPTQTRQGFPQPLMRRTGRIISFMGRPIHCAARANAVNDITIYSTDGKLVRRFLGADASTEGNFIWDGRDCRNHIVAAGIYLLLEKPPVKK
jgi:ligand-binding sensor domain-containing protein